MKDYEMLATEKNNEIKALTQKLVEIQKAHRSAFESEIRRLNDQLADAERSVKEKQGEIEVLQIKCKVAESKSVVVVGSAKSGELTGRAATAAGEYSCRNNGSDSVSPRSGRDIQKKMRKLLSQVYREILGLSKAITALLRGDEPNMQHLLGEYTRESKDLAAYDFSVKQDSDLGIEDLELLSQAISSIRSNLCDYYAEKYSNECNIQ